MDYCANHLRTEALSICKGCGKYFCSDCLTESNDYYYCTKPECEELLKSDISPEKLIVDVQCPSCQAEIELSEKESTSRKFHCPDCESYIDLSIDPPGIFPPQKFVHLLSSFNNADISIIKSILNDSGIDYFFAGENFNLVDPLIQPAKLFVFDSKLEEAKELLKDLDFTFFGVSNPDED